MIAAALYLWQLTAAFDYRPRPDRPGPDIWPRIVLALLLGAALWGGGQALLSADEKSSFGGLMRSAARAVGREEEAEKDLEEEAGSVTEGRPGLALAGIAALLAFVGAISYVGFSVASFALMLAVMLLAGYRRILPAIAIALAGTLGFFFVFQRIAYISLPLGEGPFRELSIALMALMGVR